MKSIELDVQRGPKMGVRCEPPGPGFRAIMYWKRKTPGKLFALVRDKKKYWNRNIWIHLHSSNPITGYLLFLVLVSVPTRGNRFSLCCGVILVAGVVVDRNILSKPVTYNRTGIFWHLKEQCNIKERERLRGSYMWNWISFCRLYELCNLGELENHFEVLCLLL